MVFADTADIDMESSADEIESDECVMEYDECDNDSQENVEEIFTQTRSGRVATNWKASKFVSI